MKKKIPRCIFKNQVDCYRKIGPKRGCNCVAENLFAKQFEFNPIKSWNACKINSEYMKCFDNMHDCYYDRSMKDAWPSSYQTSIFKAKIQDIALATKPNDIFLLIKHGTMDIEKINEVWILEMYNFIGTVGGSFGLFMGFSYTGFLGQVVDYFIHDD